MLDPLCIPFEIQLLQLFDGTLRAIEEHLIVYLVLENLYKRLYSIHVCYIIQNLKIFEILFCFEST